MKNHYKTKYCQPCIYVSMFNADPNHSSDKYNPTYMTFSQPIPLNSRSQTPLLIPLAQTNLIC